MTVELKTKQNITVYGLIIQNSLHCRKAYCYKFAFTFVNSRAFLHKFSLLLRCGLFTSVGNLLTFFFFLPCAIIGWCR